MENRALTLRLIRFANDLKIEPIKEDEKFMPGLKGNFKVKKLGRVCQYNYDPSNLDNYELIREKIDCYLSSRTKSLKSISEIFPNQRNTINHTLYYTFGNQLLFISGDPLVDKLIEEGYRSKKKIKEKMLKMKGSK